MEYRHIEAGQIVGSSYDDVVVVPLNSVDLTDTGDFILNDAGSDRLIVDYSYIYSEFETPLNIFDETSSSIEVFYPETGKNSVISFSNIESVMMMSGISDSGEITILVQYLIKDLIFLP